MQTERIFPIEALRAAVGGWSFTSRLAHIQANTTRVNIAQIKVYGNSSARLEEQITDGG